MIKKIILCVLTALLANGVGMAQSKKHSLPKEKDMGAYLMVYHKDCDHSLHMAISYDGYVWTALNNDRPVICHASPQFRLRGNYRLPYLYPYRSLR